MTRDMQGKKIIDARGLFCPGPLQVLKGILKQVESGTAVELLADDPDSKTDIKQWCEIECHTIHSITENEDGISFLIVKN